MKQHIDVNRHKLSYWQCVFSQSKVNGAPYNGEGLPGQTWSWPKNTYLQRQLQRQKYSTHSGQLKLS